ncbi:hypothetical protein FS847_01000 [Streptomyces sp. ISID311]|nr:hypothetical protein FS847_01000 [Streptomyces sp. ISID311]
MRRPTSPVRKSLSTAVSVSVHELDVDLPAASSEHVHQDHDVPRKDPWPPVDRRRVRRAAEYPGRQPTCAGRTFDSPPREKLGISGSQYGTFVQASLINSTRHLRQCSVHLTCVMHPGRGFPMCETDDAHQAPIVVIGLSCRKAGAEGADALWKLIVEGRRAIGPVPNGRLPGVDAGPRGPGPCRTAGTGSANGV